MKAVEHPAHYEIRKVCGLNILLLHLQVQDAEVFQLVETQPTLRFEHARKYESRLWEATIPLKSFESYVLLIKLVK